MESQYKIALLIDAENVSKKYLKLIMNEISEYGTVTYKRVYGDFTNPGVSAWKDNLIEFAMTPVFQFNYTKGKSASDSAMVIDAMDILYSGKVNGFCLVTSDSDFTKLAIRLREAGMLVVGMGEQKTPGSLVSACETFKFLDLLYHEEGWDKSEREKKPEEPVKKNSKDSKLHSEHNEEESDAAKGIPDRKAVSVEISAIIESMSDEDGWVHLGGLGSLLTKRIPGFDPRNYGYKKLKAFIESYSCYETRETVNPQNSFLKVVYVRRK